MVTPSDKILMDINSLVNVGSVASLIDAPKKTDPDSFTGATTSFLFTITNGATTDSIGSVKLLLDGAPPSDLTVENYEFDAATGQHSVTGQLYHCSSSKGGHNNGAFVAFTQITIKKQQQQQKQQKKSTSSNSNSANQPQRFSFYVYLACGSHNTPEYKFSYVHPAWLTHTSNHFVKFTGIRAFAAKPIDSSVFKAVFDSCSNSGKNDTTSIKFNSKILCSSDKMNSSKACAASSLAAAGNQKFLQGS